MRKSRLVLSLLFIITLVQAQVNNLQELTDSLLSGNATYQQAVSRYEQEKANLSIQNSLSWFDINFQYRQYDNDYTRLESGDEIEDADVEEKDKRWGIELSKQLFPKDFDNVTDAVGTRINLLRYRQELKLAYYRAAEEIWEELALWQEADAQSQVLQSRLQILYQQNQTLEELYSQKDLDPELLILNLEEIEDKEKGKLERWKKLTIEASRQSGRFTIPEVIHPTPLRGLPPYINGIENRWALYEREKKTAIQDVISSQRENGICVVIGPEGGIEETEIQWLTEHDFIPCTLGENIFRSETTPLVILSIILYEYSKK